jgi:signal recognition particle subunit SRP54
MFASLGERLQGVFNRLRGRGKLSDKDVEAALREIRLALLEADVNYKVVKDFVEKVKVRAVGHEVLSSLTPAQQVIKIVSEELTAIMGGAQAPLIIKGSENKPSVVMMVGLQGSGKTTSCAKLALYLRKKGKNPLLVSVDVYRPAAMKQLEILGSQIGVPVFCQGNTPLEIAEAGLKKALSQGNDVLLLDTAGRLHIDEEMMKEIREIKNVLNPEEVLLVVDAMTGQDAVSVATEFDKQMEINGLILTKMDGDARGGAALSAYFVTGKPIKFMGVGEKIESLEPFHPDRVARRILGMGDVLSLIEKAEASLDLEKSKKLADKLKKAEFTLEDFLDQIQQLRNMGPLDQIMGMIPGMSGLKQLKNVSLDNDQLKKIEAIICSMTPEERANPTIINGSRRKRIAVGSGTSIQEINRLLKQFEQTQALMKQFTGITKGGKRKGLFGGLFR